MATSSMAINTAQVAAAVALASSPPKRLSTAQQQSPAVSNTPESSDAQRFVVNFQINYDDLELYEHLGRGRFGSVNKALLRSRNQIVAVKRVRHLFIFVALIFKCVFLTFRWKV